jgi:NAD(P)-dependent dehydrogenase (short-subunit alcohol dehydrogenase family)
MDIKGKTFIVTGGGSGLGEGTAKMLGAAGANLVLGDVNLEGAQRVATDVGSNAVACTMDVTSEESIQAAVNLAVEKFSALNGAVNCAGVGMAMKIANKFGPHPLDVFTTVVNINLVGTFNVIRLATPEIQKAQPNADGERGVFINTASVAAFDGQIGQAAYSASKGGVAAMTLPIARELARDGIRVVTIAPGLFDTPMLALLPEPARQSLAAQIPFPSRFGKPSEFASLCKQIIENPMLNGETIRLDGSIRMQPK